MLYLLSYTFMADIYMNFFLYCTLIPKVPAFCKYNKNSFICKIISYRIQIFRIQKMKTVCKKAANFLQVFDLFAAPVLLRFKTEDDIKTKTGGCVSLLLIVLLGAAFYNSWLSLFSKSEISCQFQYFRELQPSGITFGSENFMLAVGFTNIDIQAQTNKYFDIEFSQQIRTNGVKKETVQISMVPCQRRHLSRYGSQIQDLYQKQNLKKFVCLPDNFTMTLEGKWSSSHFSYVRIRIKNCTSNCASKQNFQKILDSGGFFIDYFFVNTLVNPTSSDPITYYFQDKYYNVINDKIAFDTNLYVSQYTIETDESLFPVESINTTKGFLIDRTQKQQIVHPVLDGLYAQFHFRKSDQKIKISRSYQKIDDLFSYIGGLFGIIITFFGIFLVNYNKCCYQLEMFTKVFRHENADQQQEITELRQAVHGTKGIVLQPKQIKQERCEINFNFLTYIKYSFSRVFFLFFHQKHWKQMAIITQKLEETQNQMNVDLILQKISFYERALHCLFTQNQMTLLFLQQKISISQLKQQRMIMNFEDEEFLQHHKKPTTPDKNKVDNIFYMGNTVVTKEKQEQQQEDSLMLNLYDAIGSLKKNQKSGDLISEKILKGVRQDLMHKYISYMTKNQLQRKIAPKRISNFSNFLKSTKMIDNTYNLKLDQLLKKKVSINQHGIINNDDKSADSRSVNTFRGF